MFTLLGMCTYNVCYLTGTIDNNNKTSQGKITATSQLDSEDY